MPTEYVHIDSIDSASTSSRVQVSLPAPLMHATSVSCVSFSAPNEFHNVRDGYNTFSLLVYKAVPSSNAYAQFDYTIPPGMYTVGEIVEALNLLMATTKPVPAGSTSEVTCTLSLLANGLVSLQTNGTRTTATIKYILMYCPVGGYYQSLANRLGFSRFQVTSLNIAEHVRDSGSGVEWTDDGETWTLLADAEPKLFQLFTVSSETETNTATSDSVGFEAIGPQVMLRSSLVRDAYKTKSHGSVTRSDILQVIPIDVGPLSYIHHRGYNKQALVHSLDGRPITTFWVELCDQWGVPFGDQEFKQFSLILQFDTEVDQAVEAAHREQALLAMDQQFRSRHRC